MDKVGTRQKTEAQVREGESLDVADAWGSIDVVGGERHCHDGSSVPVENSILPAYLFLFSPA